MAGGTDEKGHPTYVGQVLVYPWGLLPASIYEGSKTAIASAALQTHRVEKNVKVSAKSIPDQWRSRGGPRGHRPPHKTYFAQPRKIRITEIDGQRWPIGWPPSSLTKNCNPKKKTRPLPPSRRSPQSLGELPSPRKTRVLRGKLLPPRPPLIIFFI